MPEKANSTKRKDKKSARAASPRAKASPKKPTKTFFVAEPSLRAVLSDQKPDKAGQVTSYATFADAKSAAIDGLVEAIEHAEAQLLALKRAESMDALRSIESDT